MLEILPSFLRNHALLAAGGLGLGAFLAGSANTVFAAEERMGFTGTYVLGPTASLPAQVLDFAPLAIPLVTITYPEEIPTAGVKDNIGATVWVEADGRVSRVLVTGGTDQRLRDPVGQALHGWRFSQPVKDGNNVTALLRLRLLFEDAQLKEVQVRMPEEPKPEGPGLVKSSG